MPVQTEICVDYPFWKQLVESVGAVEILDPGLDDELMSRVPCNKDLNLVATDANDEIVGLWFQWSDPNRPWIVTGEGHIYHKEPSE